ncbi:copper-binding protein [Noviherbaspirillum pedocola]|uniref:Copper-binding protein n=1 Tax=Noviherbaspirillum pedocola TaxID=2801341 RepID=A0A934SS98_9BURK|nr:copper-binding protein [Noviherbaspirillum pedocola]MBK4734662.1 copper-binding protein [Noviherbaspirillum pedocola]
MKFPLLKTIGTLGFVVLTLNAYAEQGSSSNGMNMGSMGGSSASQVLGTNEAEVKAVDKANKSITLHHGPIKSKTVEMTPMTMTFPVEKPSLLSNVKAGDKVAFTIENVKNVATVTALKVEK